MKLTLGSRWFSWVKKDQFGDADTGLLSWKFLERTIYPELKADGFKVINAQSKACKEALAANLGPLPESACSNKKGGMVLMCSFLHFLNYIWQPLLTFLEALGLEDTPEPEWTEALAVNKEALLVEMAGVVDSPDEHLALEEWVVFIAETLQRLLEVSVPTKLITTVVTPLAPHPWRCTRANAVHFLRSAHCARLVGPAMAAQVSRKLLAEIASLPLENLESEQDLARKVKEDLVAAMAKLHGDNDSEEEEQRPAKKLRRDPGTLLGYLADKTHQVLYMVQNRIPATRVTGAFTGAVELLEKLSPSKGKAGPAGPGAGSAEELKDLLVSPEKLNKHMLFLDGAVDRFTANKVFQMREEGRLAGVALASDESPPSAPRFSGLRFQVTCVYYGTFLPVPQWERCKDPPIVTHGSLGDIMHCPGKKGVDVTRIMEKQLLRLGLNTFDVVSGTGDGGPENEGGTGVHSFFESVSPGYVRRRCLPHISWRVCDQAMRAADLEYNSIAAYLVDGITWSRLQDIGRLPRALGGVALFADCSQKHKE